MGKRSQMVIQTAPAAITTVEIIALQSLLATISEFRSANNCGEQNANNRGRGENNNNSRGQSFSQRGNFQQQEALEFFGAGSGKFVVELGFFLISIAFF